MYFELKENKPHGTKDDPFSTYHIENAGQSFQIPVHWHDEFEIIYVKSGFLLHISQLTAHTILLSYLLHWDLSSGDHCLMAQVIYHLVYHLYKMIYISMGKEK